MGYLRVSTDEQENGPEAQERAIRDFCARNGMEVAGMFRDIGVSGAVPIDRRKGLSSALAAAELANAGALIVARWDRLSRDAEHSRYLTRFFGASGISVLSADGSGNGDTPSDRFMRGVLAEVAEFERHLIAARTKSALAAKKARGERVGTVPYGWKVDAFGKLEPNPDEQKVITMINTWRRDGRSIRWIVDRLNATGVPARPPNRRRQMSGTGEPGKWHYPTVWALTKEVKREEVHEDGRGPLGER